MAVAHVTSPSSPFLSMVPPSVHVLTLVVVGVGVTAMATASVIRPPPPVNALVDGVGLTVRLNNVHVLTSTRNVLTGFARADVKPVGVVWTVRPHPRVWRAALVVPSLTLITCRLMGP